MLGETLEPARRGAEAVEAEYEPLPSLLTVREAVEAGSFQGMSTTIARGGAEAALLLPGYKQGVEHEERARHGQDVVVMRYARDERGRWPALRPSMRLRRRGPIEQRLSRTAARTARRLAGVGRRGGRVLARVEQAVHAPENVRRLAHFGARGGQALVEAGERAVHAPGAALRLPGAGLRLTRRRGRRGEARRRA